MKKGQVTTFIILGIVIVAVVAILYFSRGYIISTGVQKEAAAFTVPEQVKPIKIFTDSCISDLAKEGVELVGRQGGYYTIKDEGIPINPVLPFTNYLDIFGNGETRVAYWFYETENGIQKNEIPTLEDIKKELEEYMNSNAYRCFDNLTEFKDYMIINENKIESEVDIKNEKVFVKINNPITIGIDDFSFVLDKHFAEVDFALGRMYNLAKQIMDTENKDLYLESKTEDIIAMYDEIPSDDVDFNCNLKIWNRIDVYNNFREIVRDNIGAITVKGTNFGTNDGYLIWDALDKDYDVNVNLMYSDRWPFKMDVEPSDGDILTGYRVDDSGVSGVMSMLCMNTYHFVYSVKYPVLVTINDRDFTFQFATQIILDHNQPRKNTAGGDVTEHSNVLCDNMINDAEIYVVDEKNNPLDDVEISYKCITSECDVGKTDYSGSLITKLPTCFNGFIIGNKDGYSTSKQQFSSLSSGGLIGGSIMLKPYYYKDLTVKIDGDNLGEDEEVILNFNNEIDDYRYSIIYPEYKEVRLISGDYDVEAYLVKKGKYTIRGDSVKQCVTYPRESILGLMGLKKEECFSTELEDLELESVMFGGNKFKIYAPISDLDYSKALNLYLQKGKVPVNYNQLRESYQLKEEGVYEFV